MQKPGFKTSEFWVTLASQVITLMALLGVVSGDDAAMLHDATAQIVALVFALIVQVVPVVIYIWSRVKVKTQQ